MSLKYRDSQGNETPVAGLNGTSGELVPSVSVIRSGTYTPSGSVQVQEDLSFSVTFSEPMPDNDYQVIFGSSSNNTSSGTIQCAVRSRDTTGFTGVVRNVGVDAIPVASGIFTWFAFKLMTDEVHEADSAHIAQNTANFAPAFSDVTSYAVGDYVIYNNVLYRCTTAHTAGAWVAGHFTQVTVGGDTASINSKIPSTASSTEKLAYVEYSPNTNLYSTWEELLELLYQHGTGYWTGTIYIGRWYTYTAKITIGISGYWYGSFLAKSAENEDLVGASKIYGATTTWTVSHYVTESDLPLVKYLYCDGAVYTSLDALLAVIIASIGQVVPRGGSAGVFNGVWTGKSHFSVQWTCAAFVSASDWSGWFSLTLENDWVDHSIYSISVSQSAIINQRAIV